jgi:tyrosyl-tRNA synthetase
MYGKIMSISDDMMWRYYELLTDVRTEQITQMRAEAASGKAHPMALKKELARSIVADFHSPDAATKAAEDWAKQFQKHEAPEDVEEIVAVVELTGDGQVRLAKLLEKVGLADSVSDATRKLKQGSVKVNGLPVTTPVAALDVNQPLLIQIGRKMKRLSVIIAGSQPPSQPLSS